MYSILYVGMVHLLFSAPGTPSVSFQVAEGPERELINEVVGRIVAEMPMLRRTYGKMVYELRPSFDWDKGKVRC